MKPPNTIFFPSLRAVHNQHLRREHFVIICDEGEQFTPDEAAALGAADGFLPKIEKLVELAEARGTVALERSLAAMGAAYACLRPTKGPR